MTLLLKDPQSRVDYRFDWHAQYAANELIEQSSWTIIPVHENGVAIVGDGHDGTHSFVSIEGGKIGATYSLSNKIIFTNGTWDERSISVRVENL
ncbi:hypothetical protein LPB140_11110 [Sphingorhabdus lutea]|uniref:Uncharacterized protein n=1 Tax=Sphingorhabdus lutea TaxID=1913578 RepID=A0A1L3JDN3_9SPHN|nr:hypothetical protein [Sphingorhabdus lutea]APG63244.1 hypothetical protein LPB140_11110 [Sphingorhabdus lutea]